jgi:putative membrane protein
MGSVTTHAQPGGGDRAPAILLALFVLLLVGTGWNPPAGRLSWSLEVLPVALEVAVLASLYARLRLTDLVYGAVLLHGCVVAYGGVYTYARTPLGEWARHAFELTRNPYDRVGHVALGLFPALLAREVLLRVTPLRRGGWLTFLVLCTILAVAAAWEIVEWWTVMLVAPEVGVSFLGTQGDPWDAQWDMLLAVVGAAASLLLFARWHDRAIAVLDQR